MWRTRCRWDARRWSAGWRSWSRTGRAPCVRSRSSSRAVPRRSAALSAASAGDPGADRRRDWLTCWARDTGSTSSLGWARPASCPRSRHCGSRGWRSRGRRFCRLAVPVESRCRRTPSHRRCTRSPAPSRRTRLRRRPWAGSRIGPTHGTGLRRVRTESSTMPISSSAWTDPNPGSATTSSPVSLWCPA